MAGRGKTVPLLALLKNRFRDVPEKELFARILCGEVSVNGERIRDPRQPCAVDAVLEMAGPRAFASRGGEKLSGALDAFALDCAGKIFIDAGASTGGFTDCLLSRGAARVYAVDVGYAQFDYRLRVNPRVRLMERTNIMSLTGDSFPEPPQAAVIDLSFRSLRGAAAHLLGLAGEGWAVALVKPQFEWENPPPDFDGVVRDALKRRDIVLTAAEKLWGEGVAVKSAAASAKAGAKGNREYFFLLERRSVQTLDQSLRQVRLLFTGEAAER